MLERYFGGGDSVLPLLPESISISKCGPSEDPNTDTHTLSGGELKD